MNNMYDVQQLLKRFGIIIYTGNRVGDLELMKIEARELFENHLITAKDYAKIMVILQKEIRQSKKR